MSQLHQIQIRYEALEDRALLRVATNDAREFRFWITRRYAKLLWQALRGSAVKGTPAVTQAAPQAREAVMAFQHEAALAKADFNTGFREQTRDTPLGVAPVLLARVKCTTLNDGLTLLALHPVKGEGIEVRLDTTLLHSLLKLLCEAAAAGEWELDMSTPSTTPGSATGPLN